MQEMWLFGRLNTLEDSKAKAEVDETAREVAELVKKLTGVSEGPKSGQTQGDEMEIET